MRKIKAIIKDLLSNFLYNAQANRQVVADKPSDVHLHVTDNCCLKCKMCNIWKLKEKQRDLDYKTATKIIDKLVEWLNNNFKLTFAGGEPFLNKDFIKIIAYAHKKGIKTSTNSNAYLIDRTLAKKIVNSNLTSIFLSVDGLEKEHNFIRGRQDSFQRIAKAINYLNEEKTNKNSPTIYINTVISNNNYAQIKKIIYFAKKAKVSGINFQAIMPNFASDYKKDWFKSNPFWPKNKEKAVKVIEELIQLKNKQPDFILNSTLDLKNIKKFFENPKLFQETEKCSVGFNNFMIDTAGNMRLCYEMGTIGNILEESPEKIWTSETANLHRKKIVKCQRPCKLLPCNNLQIINWLKRYLQSFGKR